MATELAKAYVQIIPSAQGIKDSITSVLSPEADSAGKKAGTGIAGAIKKAIATAGIGIALKKAITEGAALEQSTGGIETLFKDSADTMKKYAQEAYKTAGVSANSYMEQATSFSASLLQSVSGDTKAAANAANQAIIDMADNSNKMGTSLQDIQNAYQGFAKQNYTMLDNLKLGYGGTKTEMERLLADAQKLSGVKYDISNLSDVYEAIHVIQNSLGITGTTAVEAASTLSGSFASMKAAFNNFLGYLVIGEDIEPYIKQLVQTAATFLFNNLLPAIGNIIISLPSALVTFVTTALPIIAEQGKRMIDAVISGINGGFLSMISSGAEGVTNFITGMVNKLPDVITGIGDIITNLLEAILDAMPEFLAKGAEIIQNLVSGITSKLPDIVTSAINIITKIAFTIIKNLPQIISGGIKIIASLLAGIIKAIPDLVAGLPKVVKAITNYFGKINWGSVGKAIISGIAKGIIGAISILKDAVVSAAKSALNGIKSFLGINSPSRVFRDQVGKMMGLGIAEGITGEENAVNEAVKRLTSASVTTGKIDTSYNTSGENFAAKSITENIVNGLGGLLQTAPEGNYTINLNVDGKTLAQILFDPLEGIAMQRRVAIG